MSDDGVEQASLKSGLFTDRLVRQILKWSEKLSWLPKVGSFAGTVISFGLSIAAGGVWGSTGFTWWNTTFWLLIGAIAALIVSLTSASVLAMRSKAEKDHRVAEKVTAQENLTEAVVPLLRSIAKLAGLPVSERRRKVSQTVAQVAQAKSMLFPGNQDVRLVVFQVQEFANTRARQLLPIDFYGRSVNVPSPFRSDESGRGEKVFEWLDGPNPQFRFVADCDKEPDPSWAGTGNGYRTYISVPIVSNEQTLGMITVDAPLPGDLDETDVPMLQVMAHALATVFVVCPS